VFSDDGYGLPQQLNRMYLVMGSCRHFTFPMQSQFPISEWEPWCLITCKKSLVTKNLCIVYKFKKYSIDFCSQNDHELVVCLMFDFLSTKCVLVTWWQIRIIERMTPHLGLWTSKNRPKVNPNRIHPPRVFSDRSTFWAFE
jgi:hypothetical protein